MAAFHYQALDTEGKSTQGMIEADSARLARTQLRDKGLFVVELDALSDTSTQKGTRSFNLPFRKRIPLAEVSLMLRQLATLLEAGLPLEQALAVLIEQGGNPAMRQVIAAMRSEVLAGNTLARAMEKHRDTFPEIHRALINAGEASGELATVMDKLASYSEAQQALQQKIGLAMVYPAIVIVVAMLVVGGLLLFVVPPVVEVFQQTHQALPFLTRALIALSDFLSATWLYLIALLVIGGFSAHRALQQEALRFQLHLKLLRLPIVGKLIRGSNTARMASTLAILAGSGVWLLTALNAACGVVGNLPMRRALEDAATQGARRRDAEPRARRLRPVSACADPPHRQRRAKRPPRHHAGPRRQTADAGSRGLHRCAHLHPGTRADPVHGRCGTADRAGDLAAYHPNEPDDQVMVNLKYDFVRTENIFSHG